MTRPAEAHIKLSNISHNFALAKKLAGKARVMAVVKANAYGHGALAVAGALSDADAFGVASLAEALELRAGGVTGPIVLLGGVFTADEWAEVAHYDLQSVIHTDAQLRSFLAYKPGLAGASLSGKGQRNQKIVVWLKLDTGMHRLGFSPETFAEGRELLLASGKVKELVLMSHFASADDSDSTMTNSQLALFNQHASGFAKSLANSAAIMTCPGSHFDWVRPGIMLYGANPLSEQIADKLSEQDLPLLPTVLSAVLSAVLPKVLPAMTLRSRLIEVRHIVAGDTVGYGGQWRAPGPAKIGIVAIGYGDGYPRHAANGTPVLVGGRRAALVGRVSMDYIAVDLTALPGAQPGDEVVLWGEGLPVEEVAGNSGTIAYELLTGVRSRVNFCYVND